MTAALDGSTLLSSGASGIRLLQVTTSARTRCDPSKMSPVRREASEDTKGRYAFPFGDFSRLNRSGLMSAKQRAAQYEHKEIEEAADRLLEQLDGGS